MDILLATNEIRIQQGLKGYKRKSSAFCQTMDVDGLSTLMHVRKQQY